MKKNKWYPYQQGGVGLFDKVTPTDSLWKRLFGNKKERHPRAYLNAPPQDLPITERVITDKDLQTPVSIPEQQLVIPPAVPIDIQQPISVPQIPIASYTRPRRQRSAPPIVQRNKSAQVVQPQPQPIVTSQGTSTSYQTPNWMNYNRPGTVSQTLVNNLNQRYNPPTDIDNLYRQLSEAERLASQASSTGNFDQYRKYRDQARKLSEQYINLKRNGR